MSFPSAEVWVVEPPEETPELLSALGYLINAGVDFTFGPGDTLPSEPPESFDGIKAVLVVMEDVERVRRKLTGFRGFYPEGDQPWDRAPGGDAPPAMHPVTTGMRLALHENDETWLVIFAKKDLARMRWLEYCLFIAPRLTLPSPAVSSDHP